MFLRKHYFFHCFLYFILTSSHHSSLSASIVVYFQSRKTVLLWKFYEILLLLPSTLLFPFFSLLFYSLCSPFPFPFPFFSFYFLIPPPPFSCLCTSENLSTIHSRTRPPPRDFTFLLIYLFRRIISSYFFSFTDAIFTVLDASATETEAETVSLGATAITGFTNFKYLDASFSP